MHAFIILRDITSNPFCKLSNGTPVVIQRDKLKIDLFFAISSNTRYMYFEIEKRYLLDSVSN